MLDRKQIHLQVLHDHSNDKHNEIERSDEDEEEDDDNYDDDILIGDELEEPETFLETELIENGESDYCREVKPESVSYDYIRQQQQQKWRIQHQNRVKKPRCCRHEPGDEIMHFFKSITPYLQTMEPTTKLRVRIEIQEIILNELSKKESEKLPMKQQIAVIVSDDERDVEVEDVTVPVRKKTESKKVVIVPVRVSKRVQLKKQKLKN